MNERAIAWLVAGFGTAVYLAVAFGMPSFVGAERFGIYAYNYYFLALTEGRFDVPLRIAAAESSFDPSGRAYLYYGLAPLITRAVAWPFVDLTAISLAPLTVWLAAVGGTAVYHLVFVQTLAHYGARDAALQRTAGLLLGVMIWFTSPGLLLVVNDSLYQEPIAMGYLFAACYLGLLAQVVLFGKDIGRFLLPLAVFAGLSVFARPHVAVGLYAGVCLLGLVLLWQSGRRDLGRIAGAMAILLAFGAAQLAFNGLRFGNVLQFAGGGEMQHSVLFWGWETRDSPRMQGFINHGRFNAYRMAPNLMLYLFDLPRGALSDGIEQVFRSMTSGLGFIRVEQPRIGVALVWLPWFLLAFIGLRGRRAGLRHAWVPVLATGIGALLMASYGTVTLRYRVDLWPLLAALAMLSLPRVLVRVAADGTARNAVLRRLGATTLISLFVMVGAVHTYAHWFSEGRWSFETCAEMVAAHESLGPEAVDRLCQL